MESLRVESLKNEWLRLWRAIGAKGDADGIYNHILALYCQPPRYYHTLEGHIGHCIGKFRRTRHIAARPHEVEMALWLHDIIYDTHSDDNEERSADVAFGICMAIGLSDMFAESVSGLIIPTKHDLDPLSLNIDAQLVTDIDLSSLGASPEVFDNNNKNIRREYIWVPRKKFIRRQAEILGGFLKRPQIYATDFFHEKYEAQARRNLRRIIREPIV